jgi:outer membrane receptor for ferrienterochelin and colicins
MKSYCHNLFLSRYMKNSRNIIKTLLFSAGALILTLAATVTVVLAQTPDDLAAKSLEDLMTMEVASVYSASKHSQKVTEAPSSVSIVTSEQIQRYGYRTLAEILSSVRGFYVTYDRNYTYLGVRGFARPGDYNTRVLVLVDGHRINDNVYDQALLGRELPVEVDLIERVEVVRGSSSSLYGTSAFFAVVNVITKLGREVDGIEVSAEGASYGTYKTRVSYGKKVTENLEVLLSASHHSSRGQQLYFGEYDAPETNNGIAEDADGETANTFLANISFKDLTLQATYGNREKAVPTGSFGTLFNDPRTRTTDRRGYLDLKYERTFTNQTGVLARVSYDSYRYDGTYIYDFEFPINQDRSRGRWFGAEFQLTKSLRNHRLTLGTEYRDNLAQNQGNLDVGSPDPPLDDRRKSKNFGVFLQDEFVIRENLIFSAGARYDHHSTFGGSIKPRLALIFHPVAKTTVKLLYGEAFRAPNVYELYFFGNEASSNANLKPETIRTTELVFEKYLGDHVRVSASGYIYRIKGLISQQTDADDLITFVNREEIASKGLEFEIEGKMVGGFEGNLAYTLQKTRDQFTGLDLSNSPRHLAKLNLIAPILKRRIFAGFQLQHTSERGTLNGSKVPGFYLANLTVFSRQLLKGVEASFGAYNLFNETYSDPGSEEHLQNAIEQNGRNMRVKFTYRF